MEKISKIIEISEQKIMKFTTQIYQKIGSTLFSLGSGVLLNVQNTFWLLTASHVSECHEDGQELLIQYQINKFFSIAGKFGESNLKIDNQIDFACIRLDQECIVKFRKIKLFLSLDNTGRIQNQFEKQTLIACGFPGKLTDTSTPVITSIGKYIITTTSNEKPYTYYHFDPKFFIIVEFGGKGTDPINKKQTKSFEPHGMSGGGLWQIWVDKGEWKFALIGILTEVRKGKYHVLIANKIELVLDIIHKEINHT